MYVPSLDRFKCGIYYKCFENVKKVESPQYDATASTTASPSTTTAATSSATTFTTTSTTRIESTTPADGPTTTTSPQGTTTPFFFSGGGGGGAGGGNPNSPACNTKDGSECVEGAWAWQEAGGLVAWFQNCVPVTGNGRYAYVLDLDSSGNSQAYICTSPSFRNIYDVRFKPPRPFKYMCPIKNGEGAGPRVIRTHSPGFHRQFR